MDMKRISPNLKLAGAASVGLVGLLHLIEAPEYYGEVKYIGALFVLSAIGAAIAVAGILMNNRAGWMLGAVLAASNFAAYILSRTVGLPNFRENSISQFVEPMGLLSLAVEAIALVLCIQALRTTSEESDSQRTAMA